MLGVSPSVFCLSMSMRSDRDFAFGLLFFFTMVLLIGSFFLLIRIILTILYSDWFIDGWRTLRGEVVIPQPPTPFHSRNRMLRDRKFSRETDWSLVWFPYWLSCYSSGDPFRTSHLQNSYNSCFFFFLSTLKDQSKILQTNTFLCYFGHMIRHVKSQRIPNSATSE